MAEAQQRWRILRRWHGHLTSWPPRTALLAMIAGMVWWRWGLAGLAATCGLALVGGVITWAVMMPGRVAPPVPTDTLNMITDPRARLEVADARTRLHHDLRNGALQLLAVLAVLIGAVLGFQQLAEDRDQASQDRNRAIQDRQLTRQGQASERFTRAIDQLGSSRVETRIGGIYGLDQIVEQAPENNGPVGEVLLAWLNSRPRPRTPPDTLLREHAPDVQAALSVLTGQRYAPIVADRLNLQGASLRGANLRGGDLGGANLRRADLYDANLRLADVADANLGGANLDEADLSLAKLRSAYLYGANLRRARLAGANLEFANLGSADLYGAVLFGADLSGANLRHAILGKVDMEGADLTFADLRDADLREANLAGVSLTFAKLSGANLGSAKSDTSTRWPTGFDWRRAGARFGP